ncbi:hypothetical protein [Nocardia xishanensis]|uniref:Uncharacterized protein n=1 Tax=Nocardia xishanensis TaxID=238964 RepID=A0ABW7XCN3_9NOCA
MGSTYKVTIAPDAPDKTNATITVVLDTGGVRVTEICVAVGDDGAPLPNELAHIDFAVLVENAVLMSQGRLPMVAEATNAETIDVEPAPDRAPAKTAPHADRAVLRSDTGAAASGNARRASDSARPFNGAPSDLAVTFWRLGSITKVAKHYDVPRHIAQDWIKVLSQETKLPTSWSNKRNGR